LEETELLHVLKFVFLFLLSGNSIAESKLYIFVSNSMGKPLLKDYVKEASIYNGTLVFNGLIGGSFREVGHLVADIIGGNDIPIIIHDELFKKYHVTYVPCFILLNQETDIFDKITGNIGLKNAIDIFRERGEVLK
jgi:type-F conjugative transfer system pilin assembly protein TrbC